MISLNKEGIIEIKGNRLQILVEFGGIAASLMYGNGISMSELLDMLATVSKITKEQFFEMTKDVEK